MGISFSQERVLGFPSNEVVQLLICGHECICLRVGFKKWNIILILCSTVVGTRYVMGSDNVGDRFIQKLFQQVNAATETLNARNERLNELTSSLRQGIKRAYFL